MAKTWKYCEKRDLFFSVGVWMGKFENEFIKIDGYYITVFGSHLNGYAWDGCSPTRTFLDLYFGTPDGVIVKQAATPLSDKVVGNYIDYLPKTYYASLLHDIFYQFKEDVPLSRKTADLVFLRMMKRANFKLAYPYYWAVRAFGWMFGKWKTK